MTFKPIFVAGNRTAVSKYLFIDANPDGRWTEVPLDGVGIHVATGALQECCYSCCCRSCRDLLKISESKTPV